MVQQSKRYRKSQKKSHAFNVLSTTECKYPGCIRKLKLRIVEDAETNGYCFKHYCMVETRRGHIMQDGLPKFMRRPTHKRLGLPSYKG